MQIFAQLNLSEKRTWRVFWHRPCHLPVEEILRFGNGALQSALLLEAYSGRVLCPEA
jgi:hypothetical protein